MHANTAGFAVGMPSGSQGWVRSHTGVHLQPRVADGGGHVCPQVVGSHWEEVGWDTEEVSWEETERGEAAGASHSLCED